MIVFLPDKALQRTTGSGVRPGWIPALLALPVVAELGRYPYQERSYKMSKFAHKLRCEMCGQPHAARSWPVNGDRVPFYFQRESGEYSVEIHCPKFDKVWYVVWDDDPGPIEPV